LSVYIFLHNSQ